MSEGVIPLSVGLAAIGAVGWVPLIRKWVMRARRRTPEQIRAADDRWTPWGIALTGLALACFGLALAGPWAVLLGLVGAALVLASGSVWKDVRTGVWQRLRRQARREVEDEERRKAQE